MPRVKKNREKAVNSQAGYLSGGRKPGMSPPLLALVLRISTHPGTALNGARSQRQKNGRRSYKWEPKVKTGEKKAPETGAFLFADRQRLKKPLMRRLRRPVVRLR